jgi:hypothetical protein
MFLLTGLRPEMHNMIHRSGTYKAFNATVDAAIWAENDLQFEAKGAQPWSKKDKATEKSAAKQKQQ